MKKIAKKISKKENGIESLARIVQNGFERMDKQFELVEKRFDIIDKRLSEMDSSIYSLVAGQKETNRRLDSLEKKQTGLLVSLDETVHRSEFSSLTHRVNSLEKKSRS